MLRAARTSRGWKRANSIFGAPCQARRGRAMNRPMDRLFLALGAVNALVSVACGAFAAHGLESRVGPDLVAIFETGAKYQMYHALGLFLVGLLCIHRPS